jgi:hypothetical protein
LSDDNVGSGVDFAFEICEIDFKAVRFLVLFWVASHGDAEIWELAMNKGDQFVGVAKAAFDGAKRGVALGRVAAEGNHIGYFQRLSGSQIFAELIDRAADAGEVSRHRQVEFTVDASHDFERQLLGRAARAVRARDEAGLELD